MQNNNLTIQHNNEREELEGEGSQFVRRGDDASYRVIDDAEQKNQHNLGLQVDNTESNRWVHQSRKR
jgi:hypothetical protein